jgi:hypothetical protein
VNALRVGTVLFALAALFGTIYLLTPGEEAEAQLADLDTAHLVSVITGDTARNRKLMAMKTLSEKPGGTAALEEIAKGGDLVMAVYSSTFLGKQGSPGARSALRRLVENEGLGVEARKAAMTAIAVHFGTAEDFAYLASRSKKDGTLKAYCEWLEKEVRR